MRCFNLHVICMNEYIHISQQQPRLRADVPTLPNQLDYTLKLLCNLRGPSSSVTD